MHLHAQGRTVAAQQDAFDRHVGSACSCPHKQHGAETAKGRSCVKSTWAKAKLSLLIWINRFKYFVLIFLKGGNNRKKTIKKVRLATTTVLWRARPAKKLCRGWWVQLWTSLEREKDQEEGERTGPTQRESRVTTTQLFQYKLKYCLKIRVSVWAMEFCWRQTKLTEESSWTCEGLVLCVRGLWVHRTPPPYLATSCSEITSHRYQSPSVWRNLPGHELLAQRSSLL